MKRVRRLLLWINRCPCESGKHVGSPGEKCWCCGRRIVRDVRGENVRKTGDPGSELQRERDENMAEALRWAERAQELEAALREILNEPFGDVPLDAQAVARRALGEEK